MEIKSPIVKVTSNQMLPSRIKESWTVLIFSEVQTKIFNKTVKEKSLTFLRKKRGFDSCHLNVWKREHELSFLLTKPPLCLLRISWRLYAEILLIEVRQNRGKQKKKVPFLTAGCVWCCDCFHCRYYWSDACGKEVLHINLYINVATSTLALVPSAGIIYKNL